MRAIGVVSREPDNQAAKRYPAAKQSTSNIPAVSRETRKEAKRALRPSIAPNLSPLRVSLPAYSNLLLIQWRERPEEYGESQRFDTIPSRPSLQA
jgi:hypothetical protein